MLYGKADIFLRLSYKRLLYQAISAVFGMWVQLLQRYSEVVVNNT